MRQALDEALSRRSLLTGMVGASVVPFLPVSRLVAATNPTSKPMRFGLVTYLWGSDLTLDELLRVCTSSGVDGLELRSTHAHGVEPSMSKGERIDIRRRFLDSPVTLVGLGSDERFDSPDPATLHASIEATRRFLQLSHDVGGTGVKVKPDRFHDGIPHEKTIAQIASALDQVGRTAEELGQEVRLEVHGGCADPGIIGSIMDSVGSPSVKVCWNSNPNDLKGRGFERHFNLLRPFFGDTLHVRELDDPRYPFRLLTRRRVETGWDGWMLLEAHSSPGRPEDRIADLTRQRALFQSMLDDARSAVRTDPVKLRTNATDDGIQILAGDELLIATHRTRQGPVLFPINVPGGGQVVRGHPIAPGDGESEDHPHHRSLWLAHGDVDGHDFWHDPDARVHLLTERVVSKDSEEIAVLWEAEWRADEQVQLLEKRMMRFSATPDTLRILFDIKLETPKETVTFGDTKEGFFAIRLAPSLKVDGGTEARGRLENADGAFDRAVWGRRSPWLLAEGPLNGRLVRIRLSCDSENPRHPTWWHARTYGLVAANPFGKRSFEGADADSGSVTITPGRPLRFRFQMDLDAR